jgi:hypothetical protein
MAGLVVDGERQFRRHSEEPIEETTLAVFAVIEIRMKY